MLYKLTYIITVGKTGEHTIWDVVEEGREKLSLGLEADSGLEPNKIDVILPRVLQDGEGKRGISRDDLI